MRLFIAVALAALAAGAASAQGVVLGGWALPEGAVVTSVGRMDWVAVSRHEAMPGMEIAFDSFTDDSARTVVLRAEGGRLMELKRTLFRSTHRTEGRYEGEVLQQSEEDGSALVGLPYRAVRRDGAWVREAVGPTPEQEEELAEPFRFDDAEYPERPVRVGETWDVSRSAMAELYGDLDPEYPQRLSVRLDSVGTYGGGPVAYLTQTCDIVLLPEGEDRIVMRMAARIVRRLDWKVDVLTAWEGEARLETRTEDGRVVLEGTMRRGDRQDVTLPDGE